MLSITILLLIVSSPLIWWYYHLRKHAALDNIPGPRPLPIVGNGKDLGETPQDLLKNLSRLSKIYGNIFKVWIGPELKTIIQEPAMVEALLGSNVFIEKSNAYNLIKPWLGDGLLISIGNKWKIRRKMITPSFHFKILEQFESIFNQHATVLIKKLAEFVDQPSIDIFPYINLYSLDVICETAMGVQINALQAQNVTYVNAVRDFLNIFSKRMFNAWKQFQTLFQLFGSDYGTYKSSLATLHDFSVKVIAQRRKEQGNMTEDRSENNDFGIRKKHALLDMLLKTEKESHLSTEDIREEIDTFMFEGHDTTTSSIAFALLALADNPSVQEKCFDEINNVIGDDDAITINRLQQMKYLDMCVKEAMRVYPPVPYIERKLQQSGTIGGQFFPKDSILAVFIYGLGYMESSFPEPEKFIPERWTIEKQSERHNYCYVPFSAGPRNCIGQKFAILETKTAICKILKQYRLVQVPGFKPDIGMPAILKSYNGIQIKLEKR